MAPSPDEINLACTLTWCCWRRRIDNSPRLIADKRAQQHARESHLRHHHNGAQLREEITWIEDLLKNFTHTPEDPQALSGRRRMMYLEELLARGWWPPR